MQLPDWAFNLLLIGGSPILLWLTHRQAKAGRTLWPWHLVMGAIAAAHAAYMGLCTTSLGQAFGMGAVTMSWFLAWVLFLILFHFHGRSRDLKILGLMPVGYMVLGILFNKITDPQVQEAKRMGDAIIVRLVEFQETHGEFPDSLDELVEFDSLPIQPIGVGLCGENRFRYTRDEEAGFYLFFDGFIGVQHVRWEDHDWISED